VAVFLRGNVYWYKFMIARRLIRESANTTRKTVAIEAERNRRLEIENQRDIYPVECLLRAAHEVLRASVLNQGTVAMDLLALLTSRLIWSRSE